MRFAQTAQALARGCRRGWPAAILSDWATPLRSSMSIKRAGFFKLNLDPSPLTTFWSRWTIIAVAWFSTLHLDPRIKSLAAVQAHIPSLHFDSGSRFMKFIVAQNRVCMAKFEKRCWLTSYEQRTKPITSPKGRGWNGHRFLCVPHRSWGFNVCNKIRQTCVSKVIVFCVIPIVPESSW